MFSKEKMKKNLDIVLENNQIKDGMILDKEMMEFIIGIKYEDVPSDIFIHRCTDVKIELEDRQLFWCNQTNVKPYELRILKNGEEGYKEAMSRYKRYIKGIKRTNHTLSGISTSSMEDKDVIKTKYLRDKMLNRLFASQSVLSMR